MPENSEVWRWILTSHLNDNLRAFTSYSGITCCNLQMAASIEIWSFLCHILHCLVWLLGQKEKNWSRLYLCWRYIQWRNKKSEIVLISSFSCSFPSKTMSQEREGTPPCGQTKTDVQIRLNSVREELAVALNSHVTLWHTVKKPFSILSLWPQTAQTPVRHTSGLKLRRRSCGNSTTSTKKWKVRT